MTPIILASASATRAKLLISAGVAFEAIPAHVDEETVKQSLLAEQASPPRIADTLAELKALKVSQAWPEALVIGADLVLDFAGELVSKCDSLAGARALLARLRGRRHELYSAAVLARGGQPIWRHVAKASLWMNAFSDTFLEDYLASEGETLLSGVCCYRVEGLGVQLFSRVDGDYFSILGLPLVPLLSALRDHGALPK